jgi:hypothetical protein
MAHAASGKRSVLLVFGFFVVALLMSLHSPVWAQAATSWSYYRSNAIGMALEPLYPDSGENGRRGEAVRPDEPAGADGEEMFGAGKGEKWVLKRRSTGPGEFEEILLEDGERYSRTLRKRRGARVTELEYRSGQKVRETVFEEGRPVYEWELDEPGTEGEVTERSYRWDGEELLSVDETGGDGEAERVYLNGGDGMLGQVRRNGRVSNYAQGEEGRIRSEWHRRNGTVEIVRYGEGRAASMGTGRYSRYGT